MNDRPGVCSSEAFHQLEIIIELVMVHSDLDQELCEIALLILLISSYIYPFGTDLLEVKCYGV